MAIIPDSNDWTWVLSEPCPECGFDAATVPRTELANLIRSNAASWPALLQGPSAAGRVSEDRWSALEYGCHVRDVFSVYLVRVRLMLELDSPEFENWDQDVTAIERDYASQPADQVGLDLVAAAEALARTVDGLSLAQWERTGRRSDGKDFTVETLGRYMIHDPIHHLWDVRTL